MGEWSIWKGTLGTAVRLVAWQHCCQDSAPDDGGVGEQGYFVSGRAQWSEPSRRPKRGAKRVLVFTPCLPLTHFEVWIQLLTKVSVITISVTSKPCCEAAKSYVLLAPCLTCAASRILPHYAHSGHDPCLGHAAARFAGLGHVDGQALISCSTPEGRMIREPIVATTLPLVGTYIATFVSQRTRFLMNFGCTSVEAVGAHTHFEARSDELPVRVLSLGEWLALALSPARRTLDPLSGSAPRGRSPSLSLPRSLSRSEPRLLARSHLRI